MSRTRKIRAQIIGIYVVPTYEKTPRNLKNNSHATFLTQKNKNKSDIGNLSVFVKDVKKLSKLWVGKNLKTIGKMIVDHDLIGITFFALSDRDLIGDHENGDRPHLCKKIN